MAGIRISPKIITPDDWTRRVPLTTPDRASLPSATLVRPPSPDGRNLALADLGQYLQTYSAMRGNSGGDLVITELDPNQAAPAIALALASLGGPGRVRLPPGVFRLGATLQLGSGQWLSGAGCGIGGTEFQLDADRRIEIHGADDVVVSDLCLSGSNQSGTGLHLESARLVTLRKLRFRQLDHGVLAASGGVGGTVDLLRLESCKFADCRIGFAGGASLRDLQIMACWFETGDSRRLLEFAGQGARVVGSRFVRNVELHSPAAEPLVSLSGRGILFRFNLLAGQAPQLELRQPTPGGVGPAAGPGNLVEHNVHLVSLDRPDDGQLDFVADPIRAEAGSGAVLRGGSLEQAMRTGESAANLLVNGSFEHWDSAATPTGWTVERQEGAASWSVRRQDGALDGISENNALNFDVPTPDEETTRVEIYNPATRDGNRSLRVQVAGPGRLALTGRVAPAVERGLAADSWVTFSCWVMVARRSLELEQAAYGETLLVQIARERAAAQGRLSPLGRPISIDERPVISLPSSGSSATVGSLLVADDLAFSDKSDDSSKDFYLELHDPIHGVQVARSPSAFPVAIGQWQLLSCTGPSRLANGASCLPRIVLDHTGANEDAVMFDGAVLRPGHLVSSPNTCAVTERGGEVLGPLVLTSMPGQPRRSMPFLARLEVRPSPAGTGEECLPVPWDCSLVGLEVSTASLGQIARVTSGSGANLFDASRPARLSNSVELTQGSLLHVSVRKASAPVSVGFRFRVALAPEDES